MELGKTEYLTEKEEGIVWRGRKLPSKLNVGTDIICSMEDEAGAVRV